MLRDYQHQAVTDLRRSIARGRKRPALVAPCGSGKTRTAAEIVRSALDKGRRAMVLAPRRELVYQPARVFAEQGIDHGVILAGEEPDGTADVQIASWDTLRSWLRRERIPAPEADLILVDECHLLTQRRAALLHEHWPHARVIGLTATPARQSGLSLGDYFDDLVFGPSMGELVSAGYLLPTRYLVPTDPDLTGLRIAQGDYRQSDIEARFDRPELVGDVVSHWWRWASDRQTVVFAGTIGHAKHLRDRFVESGVTADLLHSHLPTAQRQAVLERVASGETRVLCNVDIVSLGWDQPSISCAVIARPTKSPVRYIQTAGRILRPYPGQTEALLIDHCGVVNELGLLDDDRPWSLKAKGRVQDRQPKRKREANEGELTCGHCDTEYEGQRNCPNCGWVPPEKARVPVSVDGELAELDPQSRQKKSREYTIEEKAGWYGMLLWYARMRGKKDGWAAHKYRTRFSTWPNDPRIRNAPLAEPTPEVASWIRAQNIRYAKARKKEAA